MKLVNWSEFWMWRSMLITTGLQYLGKISGCVLSLTLSWCDDGVLCGVCLVDLGLPKEAWAFGIGRPELSVQGLGDTAGVLKGEELLL